MFSFILGPLNFHTRLDGVVLRPFMILPPGWSKGRLDALPPRSVNDNQTGRYA